MDQNQFVIKLDGKLIPVTEEVYLAYYRSERHARYLEEKDARHGVVSYNSLDTDDVLGADLLVDSAAESVEDSVIHSVLLERLRKSLDLLTESECELVDAIFFQGMTEREYADVIGIAQKNVNKRKQKILEKLKKFFTD